MPGADTPGADSGASGDAGTGRARGTDVLLATVATVGWAFLAMMGVAALGLHLVGADAAGALGPMTAAAVVLAVGGSVTPSGNVRAFGLEGSVAHAAVHVRPLGVGLVGALLLGLLFLRSLRRARVTDVGELAVRAAAVAVLSVLVVAGLAWAGHDTVTLNGSSLGLRNRLGDLSRLTGGLLPDRVAGLARARASVGFTVNTAQSLFGGACWVVAVLLVALLASPRTPLPTGDEAWERVDRLVRPVVSALVVALVLAVVAGLAAAVYAAIGDRHPRLVLGAALLGAPNGVWLGVPLGLFVPWRGSASGVLVRTLPSPLDRLLAGGRHRPVTVGRLADLDGRVWLLVAGCAVLVLASGVLTAARTPVAGAGRARYAARCALRLGVASACALPLLVWLTGVSANASLSVFGFDAFGAGLDLHGNAPLAFLLGAGWGAAAGAAGALLAWTSGAAGRWARAPGPGAPPRPTTPRGPGSARGQGTPRGPGASGPRAPGPKARGPRGPRPGAPGPQRPPRAGGECPRERRCRTAGQDGP